MKQYKAAVKVGGLWAETIVFAQSPLHALKLLQAQYGANNVQRLPIQLS
jgi:hypothetical protein